MATVLLSDLVDEFEASLTSNSYSKNTVRNHTRAARELLAHVGNIQVRNVTDRHVDGFFAMRKARLLKPSSLNVELAALRALFKYATMRRYIPANADPTAHRRPFRVLQRERQRIPARDFGRLLDCADNPRDRVLLAIGLYLFLRASEIQQLHVADCDLQRGEMAVEVIKSSKFDPMPICEELDVELRRWLTFYTQHLDRPLRPDDYLVPARLRPQFVKGKMPGWNASMAKGTLELDPTRPAGNMPAVVQRALLKFGLDVRDADDKSLSEGVHTLRRSGARALFDSLVQDGYDGALRTVQSMLHHSTAATTERYLGVQLDKKRRDDIIRGRRMFHVDESNVITLAREGAAM